jgi:hypothetical protein
MNSTRGFNLQFGFCHWLPSHRPQIRGAQSWVEIAKLIMRMLARLGLTTPDALRSVFHCSGPND